MDDTRRRVATSKPVDEPPLVTLQRLCEEAGVSWETEGARAGSHVRKRLRALFGRDGIKLQWKADDPELGAVRELLRTMQSDAAATVTSDDQQADAARREARRLRREQRKAQTHRDAAAGGVVALERARSSRRIRRGHRTDRSQRPGQVESVAAKEADGVAGSRASGTDTDTASAAQRMAVALREAEARRDAMAALKTKMVGAVDVPAADERHAIARVALSSDIEAPSKAEAARSDDTAAVAPATASAARSEARRQVVSRAQDAWRPSPSAQADEQLRAHASLAQSVFSSRAAAAAPAALRPAAAGLPAVVEREGREQTPIHRLFTAPREVLLRTAEPPAPPTEAGKDSHAPAHALVRTATHTEARTRRGLVSSIRDDAVGVLSGLVEAAAKVKQQLVEMTPDVTPERVQQLQVAPATAAAPAAALFRVEAALAPEALSVKIEDGVGVVEDVARTPVAWARAEPVLSSGGPPSAKLLPGLPGSRGSVDGVKWFRFGGIRPAGLAQAQGLAPKVSNRVATHRAADCHAPPRARKEGMRTQRGGLTPWFGSRRVRMGAGAADQEGPRARDHTLHPGRSREGERADGAEARRGGLPVAS